MHPFAIPLLLTTIGCLDGSKGPDLTDPTATDTDADTDADTDSDTDADTDSDTDADTSTTGDTGPPPLQPFDIEATVITIFREPLPDPGVLCAELLDYSSVLVGGAPVVVASNPLPSTGPLQFTAVSGTSLGYVLRIDDCATGQAFPTSTFLPPMSGGVLTTDAFTFDDTFISGLQSSLEVGGYSGDIRTEGLLGVFTNDAGNTGLAGMVVSNGVGSTTYYVDTDLYDGLVTTGPMLNTETSSVGFAVVPGAPFTTYTVTDTTGTFTFPPTLAGAFAGEAVLSEVIGTP